MIDLDPREIWLGPACEIEADGRTWAKHDAWDSCECGHKPVRYVRADLYDALRARLAEAERDAARYRWLRAGRHPTHSFTRSVLNDAPEGIDAAIDAAMERTP